MIRVSKSRVRGWSSVILTFVLAAVVSIANANQEGSFPVNPDSQVTPGEVCKTGTSFRYPEKIRYCNRNVEKSLKDQIIREYDRDLGYRIGQMDRQLFKIDHLIPLCMGGSNNQMNLWPQHRSVYEMTDPFEQKLCELMAAGKLKQNDAIELILGIKHNLDHIGEYQKEINDIENRPGKGGKVQRID